MLVQIYEITTPAEAIALARIGVDHIGCWSATAHFRGSFPLKLPEEYSPQYLRHREAQSFVFRQT
jgi:hypothetical protein